MTYTVSFPQAFCRHWSTGNKLSSKGQTEDECNEVHFKRMSTCLASRELIKLAELVFREFLIGVMRE